MEEDECTDEWFLLLFFLYFSGILTIVSCRLIAAEIVFSRGIYYGDDVSFIRREMLLPRSFLAFRWIS